MLQGTEKRTITLDRRALTVLLVLALAIGIVIGSGIGMFRAVTEESGQRSYLVRSGGFRFINPLIDCESKPATELKPFRYKVKSLIEDRLDAGDARNISVYFRDLNNGHWFGINETDKFSPASLLKIPVMIAYLKRAESNPLILKTRLSYSGTEDWTIEQTLKPTRKIQAGKSYTVEDLIFRMVAYDDGNAFQVLSTNLPEGSLQRIFADLDIDYDPHKQDDSMSLTAYASFYRVLFNASYLSREMSEKALNYLSQDFFQGGMAAGVPPGVNVASKMGERTIRMSDEDGEEDVKQLHEFGIIYVANHPYLLGVMTRGDDFKSLEKIIQEISHLVYQEVYRQAS